MISREQLLAKTQRRYLEIKICDETFRLQSLTERERTEYELALQDKKTGRMTFDRSRRLLIARVLVDAEGKRLLMDEDVDALQSVDGRITGMLFAEAQKHCGYDENEIENLTKN